MRFVTPESVRIPLKNGTDWIEVKKELTVGEEKKFRSAGMKNVRPGGDASAIEIDWSEMSLARVEAYLLDWSATRPDPKNKDKVVAVPVTPAAIKSLAAEDFEEIDNAIQAHIESESAAKKAKSDSENSSSLSL
jgi:hypothetical protein